MVKNKFLKYSFFLVILSSISKILALFIKIVEARSLNFDIISLISLLFPTFNILVTISLFGTPLATQILTSKCKFKEEDTLFTNIVLSVFISFILSVIVLIISKPYIYFVLKEKSLLKTFLSLIFILPFSSISANIRGYLNGKSKYLVTSISSILEYIIKLFITFFLFKHLNNLDKDISVLIVFLLNVVYETSSILFMCLFIDKKKGLFNKKIIKCEKEITLSFTLKELVNSFMLFIEPILITNLYSKEVLKKYLYMINYNTPLLLAPTFIVQSLSSLLITSISKAKDNRCIKKITSKLIIFITLFSFIYLIILSKNDVKITYLIFKVKGPSYIKEFPFTFLLLYTECIFTIIFDAIGKTKINLFLSLISCFIRSFSLITLSLLNIGIKAYIYSLNINIIITFIIEIYFLKRSLFSQKVHNNMLK